MPHTKTIRAIERRFRIIRRDRQQFGDLGISERIFGSPRYVPYVLLPCPDHADARAEHDDCRYPARCLEVGRDYELAHHLPA